jgi:sorbitol-6-phosphate 2-dehydrogenase
MKFETLNKGYVAGKVAVVIGGSRGIGEGIVRSLAGEGAFVVIVCSKTIKRAQQIATELNQKYSHRIAIALQVNITNEEAVKAMVEKVVESFGGVDILVYSAAVIKAGSVKTFKLEDFEQVTKVNYTGYFLCVTYISRIMSEQRKNDPSRIMDIIQINSKSGLQGSKKNFAYAGSKFGGIGLTQSFALELWEDGIKVNAICPGNVFDSDLWQNSENGLFVKYLKAGKVPEAKTIEDIKQYYESKIVMGRGCTIKDILCAVRYVIEQRYETGQAILVAGGQIMR